MNPNVPLAERIRPNSLAELLGQEHLVGKTSILRTAIQHGKVPSMIFWGLRVPAKQLLPILLHTPYMFPFFSLVPSVQG